MNSDLVYVVGGGLAGCECAWQLAERGWFVRLFEQRPATMSPAHRGADLAELVCSNSFRGASMRQAVGVLKQEMRMCGSLVMRLGEANSVPAGQAMAVDRDGFAHSVTEVLEGHPRVEIVRERIDALPEHRPTVIATGPLTSVSLASELADRIGTDMLAYYDAIAPIVDAESVDWQLVFEQSRQRRGGERDGDADYVNCPMDEGQYLKFVQALVEAEKVEVRSFESAAYFEGCLPVEVMAERGPMTLAFGPMKPVGLTDPRTGRRPFAVVQLRAENRARTAFNLVGFQTRMTHAAQRRVLRTIPGLERASFLRLGSMHRNTFVDAPHVLSERLELRRVAGTYLAGQISGVEGYVESAASGLMCGVMLATTLAGCSVDPPPCTTVTGGLLGHLRKSQEKFQPSNATWAQVDPIEGCHKRDRKDALAARALADMQAWVGALGDRGKAPEPAREVQR